MKTERNRVKTWRVGAAVGMLALFAAMPSCSGSGFDNWGQHAEVGVLSLPLEATSAAGIDYKLVGQFHVGGAKVVTISANQHTGSEVRRSLAVGSYTITLANGWKLLKRTDSGFVAVTDVVLLSQPTQSFLIVDGEVTRVVFSFKADGQVLFGSSTVPEGGAGGADGQDSGTSVDGQDGLGGDGSTGDSGQAGNLDDSGEAGAAGGAGQGGGMDGGGVGNDSGQAGNLDDSGEAGAGQGGGMDDGGFGGGVGDDSGQAGNTDDSGQAGAGGFGNTDGGVGGGMGTGGFEDSGVPILDASSDDGALGANLRAMAISTSEEESMTMLRCLHHGSHSCAVRLDGSVVCWGANASGELGNGTRTSSAKPVKVLGIDRATQVTAGGAHSCARLEDGTVWCWGSNAFTQTETPLQSWTENTVPFKVNGISSAVSISSASLHICALLEDRTIACWGQLRMMSNSEVPRVVMTDATMLSAGGGVPFNQFVCAIRTDGSVACWEGDSSAGTPHTIEGVSDAIAIASGGGHGCAVQRDGLVRCWGANSSGQLGTTAGESPYVQGIVDAIGIAAGRNHSCALLAQGSVMCWGSNSDGQLGDGTLDNRFTPVEVSGVSRAIAISAAGRYTCALIDDNSVRCWGYNGDGALGDGTDVTSTVPVRVADVVDAPNQDAGDASQCARAQTVAAGADHTCAVFDDSTVRCWGSNALGQLGNATPGDSATPVLVQGIGPAISVSAGRGFSCAVLADRTVQCWGDNTKSQLGMQCQTNAAIGVSGAVAIASGYDHSCAVIEGGSVQCWGNPELQWLNADSRFGEPSNLNIQGATAVSAEELHSCVGRADGAVVCWGKPDIDYSILSFLGVTDPYTPTVIGGSAAAATIQSVAAIGFSICAAGGNQVSCVGERQYQGGAEVPRHQCASNFSWWWRPITPGTAVTAGSSHFCALRDDGVVVCWGGTDETRGCQPIALPPLPIVHPMQQPCRAGAPPCVAPLPARALQISAGALHTCAVLEDRSIACWGNNAHGQLGGGVGGTLDGGASPVVTRPIGTGCQP